MSLGFDFDKDYVHKYGVVDGKLYFAILRESTSLDRSSVHHYAQSEDGAVEEIQRSVIKDLFNE